MLYSEGVFTLLDLYALFARGNMEKTLRDIGLDPAETNHVIKLCAKAFCRVQRESDRIRLQAHDTLADVLLRESPMALSQMRLNDAHHAPYLASQADTFGAFYT